MTGTTNPNATVEVGVDPRARLDAALTAAEALHADRFGMNGEQVVDLTSRSLAKLATLPPLRLAGIAQREVRPTRRDPAAANRAALERWIDPAAQRQLFDDILEGLETSWHLELLDNGQYGRPQLFCRGAENLVLTPPPVAGCLVLHNHPGSGPLRPSEKDITTARHAAVVGAGFGLLDEAVSELYVIIAPNVAWPGGIKLPSAEPDVAAHVDRRHSVPAERTAGLIEPPGSQRVGGIGNSRGSPSPRFPAGSAGLVPPGGRGTTEQRQVGQRIAGPIEPTTDRGRGDRESMPPTPQQVPEEGVSRVRAAAPTQPSVSPKKPRYT